MNTEKENLTNELLAKIGLLILTLGGLVAADIIEECKKAGVSDKVASNIVAKVVETLGSKAREISHCVTQAEKNELVN